jgi:predicted CoA-binding protein
MTEIDRILKHSRTIAIVGLSCKPHRTSHEVAQYLQQHGYRIIPVNPSYAGTDILGERCHATLQEAAQALGSTRIDIVDCFRKAQDIAPVAQAAIDVGAGCLWMQLGIAEPLSADLAQAAGLDVVMNRCIKIEHMHLPH